MTEAVFLGCMLGLGLIVFISGVRPARPSLSSALAKIHRSRSGFLSVPDGHETFIAKLVGTRLSRTGLGDRLVRSSKSNLRILGRRPEDQLARYFTFFFAGLFLPLVLGALLSLLGLMSGFGVPLFFSLICSFGLTAVEILSLKGQADERRRSFRHALGAFLDVVAVSLASGRGIDSALQIAGDIGHGWAFTELRRSLLSSRLAGETPWAGLARLGEELDVTELRELAATTGLAGDEGARVRQSLVAKAASLRQKGMAEAQAQAEAATERMAMPIVLLMAGFSIFIGYPALAQVIGGVSGTLGN